MNVQPTLLNSQRIFFVILSEVMWSEVTWFMWSDFVLNLSEVMWSEVTWFIWSDFVLNLSEVTWFMWSDFVLNLSEVMRSEVTWFIWSDFVLNLSEVKWVTVKFLGTKVPCTLGWPYTEGTWLYCDYFLWCVSCSVVLTSFVMCGCFGNMCTCIYCVVLFVLCFCIVSFMYIYSYLFCLY